jgi:hypothetical protein|tara:strand:- start:1239 stop:1511 length:273 start_codon:yes stop_codon:yes gene_type:complete
MAKKPKLYKEKVMKYKGARHYLIKMEGDEHYKHHRWDAPAVVPITKDSEFSKGYFLNGIEYDVEDFNEIMQERQGLPWYKTSAGKGTSRH